MHTVNQQFSSREKEVVELLLQGKSIKQIALVLGISERTAEYHLKNVYKKLQVNSRTAAVLRLGKSSRPIFRAAGYAARTPVSKIVPTETEKVIMPEGTPGFMFNMECNDASFVINVEEAEGRTVDQVADAVAVDMNCSDERYNKSYQQSDF